MGIGLKYSSPEQEKEYKSIYEHSKKKGKSYKRMIHEVNNGGNLVNLGRINSNNPRVEGAYIPRDELAPKQRRFKFYGRKSYKDKLRKKYGDRLAKKAEDITINEIKTPSQNIAKSAVESNVANKEAKAAAQNVVKEGTKKGGKNLLKKFIPKSNAGKIALGTAAATGLAAGGYAAYKHYKDK